MLRVGQKTISRDLSDESNDSPKHVDPAPPKESRGESESNDSPAWFQDDDVDPAKLATSQRAMFISHFTTLKSGQRIDVNKENAVHRHRRTHMSVG